MANSRENGNTEAPASAGGAVFDLESELGRLSNEFQRKVLQQAAVALEPRANHNVDDKGIDWPLLPGVEKDDPQVEVKKVGYQGRIDAILAEQKAGLDATAARAAADVDREKARVATEADLAKASLAASVAARAAQDAADVEVVKADRTHYLANLAAVYAARLEVAKGTIDRARARAEFIEKAAAAIASLYTGVLALVFTVTGSADTTPANRLPSRGVLPAAFLGLAIVLSVVYLAFITRGQGVTGAASKGNPRDDQKDELDAFVRWTSTTALRRREFLQAAVLSLALGVVFLPVAFLDINNNAAFYAAGGAIVTSLVVLVVIARVDRN